MSYVSNPLVEWLLHHAYGQGGTVAVPSSASVALQAPRGEFPAGIEDILTFLSNRYLNWTAAGDDYIEWCFLTGGPGNGKSEALNALVEKLGIQLPTRGTGEPVPRTLPVTWPTSTLMLSSGLNTVYINDASIPRKDSHGLTGPGSLFLDLSDGLAQLHGNGTPVAIFGNVNRGILVEEAGSLLGTPHALVSSPLGSIAADMIRWLSAPLEKTGEMRANSAICTTVPVSHASSHYGQFVVTLPNIARKVRVHVVFLDVLSLLEPRPGAGGPVIDFSMTPAAVAKYQTLGNLISTELPRDETTAGRLIKSFVDPTRWIDGGCRNLNTGTLCEAYETCPFAQNARWVFSDHLRHRLLDTMRGAEIAAGRRLTYRDLLGHISLAFLGKPEESWLQGTHPCDWSRQQHQDLDTIGRGKGVTVALVAHRIYTNLFSWAQGGAFPSSSLERQLSGDTVYGAAKTLLGGSAESPRVQAFEKAFHTVDPARDTDGWNSLRVRTLDVVEALDILPPSTQITQWAELPAEAHSKIEELLDHALREEVASELSQGSRASAKRVRVLRRWRSILLLRQVGVGLGQLCFGTAIQAWLAEQENALRQEPRLKLGDGVHSLIIPQEGGRVFLAPLRPRTYCLSRDLPSDTLLVSIATADLQVEIVPQGDTLVAEVSIRRARERLDSIVLAAIVIDLSIAREALLHTTGDTQSFTEIGYTAFARIERARASLISRLRMRTMPVLFTDSSEKLYRVSATAGGPVPLRVQTS